MFYKMYNYNNIFQVGIKINIYLNVVNNITARHL